MMTTRTASDWLVALGLREPPLPVDVVYDLWSVTYPPCAHNPLMRAEQAAVASILEPLSPRCALDLGTGSGRNLAALASAGAQLVVGLDRSMGMLARHEGHPLRVRGDALHLPIASARFDLVTASLMVGDIADLAGWAREAARVLAPGGHLVYSDFHPSWAARGWRRTFRAAGGRLVVVPYVPHSLDQHLSALEGAGLRIVAAREPFLLEEDMHDRTTRTQFDGVRVALVLHAIRPRELLDSWGRWGGV